MAFALLALAMAAAALPATPVPDAELATMRGGFRLPNGIDLALAVQTDTSVNGALLLRSIFAADRGPATLQVLAPAQGDEPAPAARATASGSSDGGVTVQFDRQVGVVIVPAPSAAPAVSVGVGAQSAADASSAGLSVVPVAAGTPAIETAGGAVSVEALPDGARVRLEGAGLDVSHVVGTAFGSVIANTGSDRMIDTTTTVSLDLSNAGPDVLGSTMFRVENVAVEAAQMSVR